MQEEKKKALVLKRVTFRTLHAHGNVFLLSKYLKNKLIAVWFDINVVDTNFKLI